MELDDDKRSCRLLLLKPDEGGLPFLFYIEISTNKCTPEMDVINLFVNKDYYSKASSLKVGESATFRSGSLIEELSAYEKFTRQENIVLDGNNSIVLKNNYVWEFGDGQTVYLIKKDSYFYAISVLVRPEESTQVTNILSTFKFLD